MPKITVNPEELERKAGEIDRLSERLSKLTGRISSVCLLAGSYDGQFKPRVVQLAGHMNSKIMQSSTRTSGSSKKLQNISKRFLEADGQFGSSSANTSFMDRLQEIVGGIIGGFGPGIISQLGLIASLGTVFTFPNMPWNPTPVYGTDGSNDTIKTNRIKKCTWIESIKNFFFKLFNRKPNLAAPDMAPIDVVIEGPKEMTFNFPKPATEPFLGGVMVTGGFPVYNKGNQTLHNGIDIKPLDPNNTDVHPIGPGKIVDFPVWDEKKKRFVSAKTGGKPIEGYGDYVVVEHKLENGRIVYSTYAHMKRKEGLRLELEQTVDSSSILGEMSGKYHPGPDASERAYPPHLHLTVHEGEAWWKYGYFKEIVDSNGKTKKIFEIYKPGINGYAQAKAGLEKHWINPQSVLNDQSGEYQFVATEHW